MNPYLRKLFFRALYFTGIGHVLNRYHTKRYLVPILLFHRVSDKPDPYWSPLPVRDFKSIINFFSKKYTIRPIQDLFEKSADVLKGSCFIVFDDAYRDFLVNVLPFLREKNLPVTMFIPVESVGTGIPIWTTHLNMCIDQATIDEIIIDGGERVVYDLSTRKAKIKAAHKLTLWLKSLPYEKFRYYFDEILRQTGDNPDISGIAVMSWDEIRRTADEVDYQSHTMTHPMLGNITNLNILNYEVSESKKIIEREIDRQVQYISYPIGSYSDTVMERSGEYYEASFAVDGDLVDLTKVQDPHYRQRIPRFNISDSDPYELFFRINGFHRFLGR